ncbi:MAG: hypothetical protein KJ926_01615, partial [Candidatus Omnitrophica bacterium]|nr:hypothetical protein [Candidatus Omnitrophota bacterium]
MKNTFSRDGKYKNYWKYLWLIIYCLFFFAPKCAYAGGISALSVLYTSHMLIGNAIIGIFEGLIIARLFGVRLRRSISIMILANYISMIAGAIGIQPLKNTINNHASINNFFPIIIIMLILSYLTTMSIQWFFCFWILKGKEGRGCISLKASIIVNIISYAIFIPFYFSASDISAISNMKIEKSPYFLKTNNAWIYFISLKDGALYKIKANGSDKQRIKDTGSTNQDVELFTCNKDE